MTPKKDPFGYDSGRRKSDGARDVEAVLPPKRPVCPRLAKVIGTAELRDFIVGPGDGEIPIGKLRTTLMKLPRTASGKDVNALDTRLKALSARPQMPIQSSPVTPAPAVVGRPVSEAPPPTLAAPGVRGCPAVPPR